MGRTAVGAAKVVVVVVVSVTGLEHGTGKEYGELVREDCALSWVATKDGAVPGGGDVEGEMNMVFVDSFETFFVAPAAAAAALLLSNLDESLGELGTTFSMGNNSLIS